MMEFKISRHRLKIDNNEEHIITLQAKVTENHKKMISHQKKFKLILEGMELVIGKKKRLKSLDGLKYDVDQDAMVTMDFTPSTVYRTLQVTVISDYGW